MLRRIRERRRGLLVAAGISLVVAAVVGVFFVLFVPVPLSGKAPPPSEILRRSLFTAVNAAIIVFWVLFVPQAVVELLKRPPR
jgi:hypothetical protein